MAEVERELAGYVNVVWEPNYPRFKEDLIPKIQDFNVLIKYRRRGIGTILMDKSEEVIKERSEFSGLGVGLYRDYGAAQQLYINVSKYGDGIHPCRHSLCSKFHFIPAVKYGKR